MTPDDFVSNIGSLKSQSAKNGDTSINVDLLSDAFRYQGLLIQSEARDLWDNKENGKQGHMLYVELTTVRELAQKL